MTAGVGGAERGRTAVEQGAGGVLLEVGVGALGIDVVADVGQSDAGAGVGEAAGKRQGVLVVGGVVVGDDHVGGHGVLRFSSSGRDIGPLRSECASPFDSPPVTLM